MIKNTQIFNDFLEEQLSKNKRSPETIIMQKFDSYSNIKAPFHLSWEITSKCNFKCVHCRGFNDISQGYIEDNISLEDYFRVIDDLASNEILSLGITGGEPFMHKDILSIIERAKQKRFKLIIYTNGSYINEDIAKKLQLFLETDDIIHISLDGGIKEDNDRQRGKGSFEKTLKGLKVISKYRLPFRLTVVPTIFNIEHIENIILLAKKYGAHEVSAVPLMDVGRATGKNLRPDINVLFDKEITMIRLAKKNKILYSGGVFGPVCMFNCIPGIIESEITRKKIPFSKRICDAGTRQLYINCKGDVFPCHLFAKDNKFLIGNIYKNTLKEIWENKKLNIFKTGIEMNNSKCENCPAWSICDGGCMGLSWNVSKKLNVPDPRCQI